MQDETKGLVTKDLLKALRGNNRSIVVEIETPKDTVLHSGTAKIRISRDVKTDLGDADVSKEFEGFNGWINKPEYNKAVFVDLFPSSGTWQALSRFLKVGDRLDFHASDNTNGYLEKAEIPVSKWVGTDGERYHSHYDGLHNDCLYVDIYRKGKPFIRNLLIDYSVCPDNTARRLYL